MTEVLDTAITDNAVYRGPSAQAWFAVGERVGYDPKARAIVDAQDAPLKTFLKREGEVSHAVTFLPGYPDGSFGWAKVRPHLPNAAEMSKLFVEYVGMGDSDKPKDYAYSTAVALLSGCLARGSSRRSRSLRSTTSA
jgi:pimeloyl-ACP methyl ester carboxylesterase